jgi:CRISPR/Cas system-associated protein endoribonuclease Cas2
MKDNLDSYLADRKRHVWFIKFCEDKIAEYKSSITWRTDKVSKDNPVAGVEFIKVFEEHLANMKLHLGEITKKFANDN